MMTFTRLLSRGQRGLHAYPVAVEVHLAGGLPGLTITGLPDAAVRESRERVRAALTSCGFPLPPKRITVHLGPAGIPKDGGRFDLPIAVGIYLASKARQAPAADLELIGELSLNGELRAIPGILPSLLAARTGGHNIIIPAANQAEARVVGAGSLLAPHLLAVIAHLEGEAALSGSPPAAVPTPEAPVSDLAEVQGQPLPKRALTIAAAGGHHLLMTGPPGSGKSLLAARLPGILPPLEPAERLEVACIRSVSGLGCADPIARPFRAPHHSTSRQALLGGGAKPRPGEVTLAHLGVLFLDELPEFSQPAIDGLREPMETGLVNLARVLERVSYPARFQLVAAMNPCPCGFFGDAETTCHCSSRQLARYRQRVSGPVRDRFDLLVTVARVGQLCFRDRELAPESPALAATVLAARQRQRQRQNCLNAMLAGNRLRGVLHPTAAALALVEKAADCWRLSARSSTRILRCARTIADLENSHQVHSRHVAEALHLRVDPAGSNNGQPAL